MVLSYTVKPKLVSIFLNYHNCILLHQALAELDHSKLPILIITDNITTYNLYNDTLK